MKYLIEIDSETAKGSQLIKYIESLDADDAAVHILNEPSLTDEEMVMPGSRPSQERLDEWLRPDKNEKGLTLEQSKEFIKNRVEQLRKDEGK